MNKPIGIFDSGVGGLIVLDQLIKSLPNESFEYYADSDNCPYGSKTMEDVLDFSKNIMDYLTNKGCKMIIVACNTITTNIIDELRKQYIVPIVGLEPGTKMAYNVSKNKRIGILATEGTINGQLYNKTLNNLIDKAFYKMRERLMHLIKPMLEMDIDTLVLGCTHYNYLKCILLDLFPYQIELVDTTKAVTKQVVKVLNENKIGSLVSPREINIVSTGKLDLLYKLMKRLDIDDPGLNLGKVPAYTCG